MVYNHWLDRKIRQYEENKTNVISVSYTHLDVYKRQAEEAGCQAIGGKGMLLYQGVVNYSLFTGKDFPIEEYQKFQAEQAK